MIISTCIGMYFILGDGLYTIYQRFNSLEKIISALETGLTQ